MAPVEKPKKNLAKTNKQAIFFLGLIKIVRKLESSWIRNYLPTKGMCYYEYICKVKAFRRKPAYTYATCAFPLPTNI